MAIAPVRLSTVAPCLPRPPCSSRVFHSGTVVVGNDALRGPRARIVCVAQRGSEAAVVLHDRPHGGLGLLVLDRPAGERFAAHASAVQRPRKECTPWRPRRCAPIWPPREALRGSPPGTGWRIDRCARLQWPQPAPIGACQAHVQTSRRAVSSSRQKRLGWKIGSGVPAIARPGGVRLPSFGGPGVSVGSRTPRRSCRAHEARVCALAGRGAASHRTGAGRTRHCARRAR